MIEIAVEPQFLRRRVAQDAGSDRGDRRAVRARKGAATESINQPISLTQSSVSTPTITTRPYETTGAREVREGGAAAARRATAAAAALGRRYAVSV